MQSIDSTISQSKLTKQQEMPYSEAMRIINNYFEAGLNKEVSNKKRKEKLTEEILNLKKNFGNQSHLIDEALKKILKQNQKEINRQKKENESVEHLINRVNIQAEKVISKN